MRRERHADERGCDKRGSKRKRREGEMKKKQHDASMQGGEYKQIVGKNDRRENTAANAHSWAHSKGKKQM